MTAGLCEATIIRLDRAAVPSLKGPGPALAEASARVTDCWVEEVPAAADSGLAARYRERELNRAVDPVTGPARRAVLLRYADGPADLIVVTHRRPDWLDRVGATVPDWLVGGPDGGSRAAATPGRHAFTVPAAQPVQMFAALGLVLARYTGADRVDIGRLEPAGFPVDPAATVREYLAGVAAPGPAAAAPVVGLAVAAAARAFLAPVYPLTVHVDGTHGVCHYRAGTADPGLVAAFAAGLASAVGALLAAPPDAVLGTLLDDLARRERPRDPEPPQRDPEPVAAGAPARLDDAIAAQAAARPDAVAVSLGGDHLTYRELVTAAGRIAAGLGGLGVGPGTRVGVCLDRSLDLIAVLLGVWQSGAAYVPMDPEYPPDRLAFTTIDANLPVVITDLPTFPPLPGVHVARPDAVAKGRPAPGSGRTPTDDAYVIYTSGSTGEPKGVPVPHANIANLIAATRERFRFGPDDVWTLFHSSAFDFSVWEIWGCLSTGGRLVIVPRRTARAPDEFADLLTAERVTVLNQTPGAFAHLLEVDRVRPVADSVRLVIFGGEPLDTGPLLGWFDRHPDCRLVNMYGITETTVHVTAQPLTRKEALDRSRSVGRPLPGWRVYVLDPSGRPVPPGVAGEIYVSGVGVARGYLNRPELTAERFLPDRYGPGTMYRSGDRGRFLPDGRLEHLGRLDSQVKLRGHRIELGEVRARLLDAPGVAAATVVLRPDPDALHAYVVLLDGAGDPEEVLRDAARFLPGYMVPATVTALPALPLTPNGKVDHARLPDPAPPGGAPAEVGGAPPGGAAADGGGPAAVEDLVAAAWERVFGVRVSADDDFFALGGTSLLAVRLSAALRAAGLAAVPLAQIYLRRTVRGLAGFWSAA